MSDSEVIRAIEQATALMLFFHEQKKEELGSVDEPLDSERLLQALAGFAHARMVLFPAGKKCPHCNGTGIAPKPSRKGTP
jgi:hypothetical protein